MWRTALTLLALLANSLVVGCGAKATVLLVNVSGTVGDPIIGLDVSVTQSGVVGEVSFPPAPGTNAIPLPTSFSIEVAGADGSDIMVCVTAVGELAPIASGCASRPITVGSVNEFTITLIMLAPVCGDGVIVGTEECEAGDLNGQTCETVSPTFVGGTLACSPSCMFDTSGCDLIPSCGNDMVDDVSEDCDGSDLDNTTCIDLGYPGGSLDCLASCQFDESRCWWCGNGVTDPGEPCDGADLAGADCVNIGQGFDGGMLGCDVNCNYDVSSCTTPPGCGDGACAGVETCASCPGDCGVCCGNGTCEPGFGEDCTLCPADCGLCPPGCGDGMCDATEDCNICPPDCGPCPPMCGNGMCDAGEDCTSCPMDCSCGPCDFDGTCDVSAGEDCSTCSDCGSWNAVCESNEDCNSCPQDCGMCTGCGNGVHEPPAEQCDGTDFGGADCTTAGFDGGMLGCTPLCGLDTFGCWAYPDAFGEIVITEIMNNPSGVPDLVGEWFEIYNTLSNPMELDGTSFSDSAGNTFQVMGTLIISPFSYAVLAIDGDTTVNGGVNADYDYPNTFTLSNITDQIWITGPFGTFIDDVSYDPGWPGGTGASMSYSATLPPDATLNDQPGSWCSAMTAYGSAGDLGTPGSPNDC